MICDVHLGVHQAVVVDEASQIGLEGAKYADIQRLQLVSCMWREGDNHDAVVHGIFNGMDIHMTFCIIHDKYNLVVWAGKSFGMNVLQRFQETIPVHPAIVMKDALRPIDFAPHESLVPPFAWDYKYWGDVVASSIYNSRKRHGASSFPRYL